MPKRQRGVPCGGVVGGGVGNLLGGRGERARIDGYFPFNFHLRSHSFHRISIPNPQLASALSLSLTCFFSPVPRSLSHRAINTGLRLRWMSERDRGRVLEKGLRGEGTLEKTERGKG